MKKGFIFIETMMVLVMVIFALMGVFKSYNAVARNLKRKEYYDNVNDIYKANIIKNNFTSFSITGDYLYVNSANCSSYMNSDCESLLNDMKVNYIVLISGNINNIYDSPGNLPNSFLSYLGVLDTEKLLIVSVQNVNQEYFASLKVGE